MGRWRLVSNHQRLLIQMTDFPMTTHYSKSQILVQKFNFDKTPTFSRVFHPKFFWQFFLWNQSCQQLKSPNPQHFHEFFTQKNRQFSREIKVEFLDKKWRFQTVCRSTIFWENFSSVNILLLKVNHEVWRMYNLAKGFFFFLREFYIFIMLVVTWQEQSSWTADQHLEVPKNEWFVAWSHHKNKPLGHQNVARNPGRGFNLLFFKNSSNKTETFF